MNQGKSQEQPSILIRRTQAEDATNLLAYLEQVSGESDNLSYGPGEFGLTLEQEITYLSKIGRQSNALNLVATVNGQIIGNLSFHGGSRPRIRHLGQMGITVARDWWGRGVATRLIRELIGWSHDNGIRKINLHVRTDNDRAIALYEKLGFHKEGCITRDLQVDGVFHDVWTMGLQLDPPLTPRE